MNSLLREIYSTGLVYDEAGQPSRAFPAAIKYRLGMTLYELILATHAEKSLEVGMAFGLSTLFMCQAHHDKASGMHTAIDPTEETAWKSIGLLNVDRAALSPFLDFRGASSHEVLPQLLRSGQRFDVIFIDGMHLFDYAMVDFFYADLLLKEHGYLVFDDIWMPSIRKVLYFALRNRTYTSSPQHLWNRKSFWRRARELLRDLRQDSSLRQRTKRMLGYFLRDPLDIYSFRSAMYFSGQGGLDCWILQKNSEDGRGWHDYRAF